ncbi:hypothetical protein U1Q18_003073, partial [Sarracenia purpurea var. burkii]
AAQRTRKVTPPSPEDPEVVILEPFDAVPISAIPLSATPPAPPVSKPAPSSP